MQHRETSHLLRLWRTVVTLFLVPPNQIKASPDKLEEIGRQYSDIHHSLGFASRSTSKVSAVAVVGQRDSYLGARWMLRILRSSTCNLFPLHDADDGAKCDMTSFRGCSGVLSFSSRCLHTFLIRQEAALKISTVAGS